jgi:hypothetical protein
MKIAEIFQLGYGRGDYDDHHDPKHHNHKHRRGYHYRHDDGLLIKIRLNSHASHERWPPLPSGECGPPSTL